MTAVWSEKCVARWGSEYDDICMITTRFVRVLQRCAGPLYTHFLLIFQEVRSASKTCNQLIWKHVESLFPSARQGLDYYHCKEYLHKVAKVHYDSPERALEWVEATLTRLYLGKVGWVLGGLRRMQPASEEARKASDNCWVYLQTHRDRTRYGKL